MLRFAPFARLSRRETGVLSALLVAVLGFGVVVEYRSAISPARKTDLAVYARAGWMVRSGESIYEFTVRHYHFNNLPFLAILLVPLAEAPADSAALALPFAVSVGAWFLLNLIFVGLGVHVLATALEQTSADPAVRVRPVFCRRWWLLRAAPILVCAPGILRTLALGQADLLVLVLLCVTAASALHGRSRLAGLTLAAAAAIKLIPAFLVLWPLARRDRRALVGFAAGLVLWTAVVPAVTLGPDRAWQQTSRFAEVVMLPGIGLGSDRSRNDDLIGLSSANSQSLLGVVHSLRYPDREHRPDQPDRSTRLLAWGVGGLMALVTLTVASRRRGEPGADLTAFGMLIVVMLLLVPTCHPHYLCHWLPLALALVAVDLEKNGNQGLSPGLIAVLAFNPIANGLTSVPGLEPLRDFGLATCAGLLLWMAGLASLVGAAKIRVNFPTGSALLKG